MYSRIQQKKGGKGAGEHANAKGGGGQKEGDTDSLSQRTKVIREAEHEERRTTRRSERHGVREGHDE